MKSHFLLAVSLISCMWLAQFAIDYAQMYK